MRDSEICVNSEDRPLHYLEEKAVFHYMLACYNSALGNLDDAKEGLVRAIELKKSLRLAALDEPDLAPLWESL